MLFNKFPREVGPPRKVVYNINEWLNFVNLYNGKKKAVYTSIYCFEKIESKPVYESAIIDKLFFDFDDKSCDAWKECNTLHKTLLLNNIKHLIIMSGRGYHLYVFCLPLSPKNPKSTIYNAQISLINNLNLVCDKQVIGDYSRLRRIPNSYHLKAQRFCICLTKEEFSKGYEFCKELAKKQNFKKEYIGEKLFDISNFDYKTKKIEMPIEKFDFEDSENADYINNSPDFIKGLLSNKELGWRNRYLLILFFKEKGFTIQEVYNILKKHLSERKFKHCIGEEKQLQYLFERDDLVFPEKYCKVYK